MISVIIPTLWKSNRIFKTLSDLVILDKIKEIILIDNDPKNFPENFTLNEKIIYLPQKENLFVNPSWNTGANHATQDVLVFCNDDINFDVSFFNSMIVPEGSLLGMHEMNYILDKNHEKFIYFPTNKITYGFGCLMILNKRDFVNIPSDLKIYYGDNFLMSNSKISYAVYGLSIKTEMSTSSKIYENSEMDMSERFFFQNCLNDK
jgi:hypothetical protein